jgi:hypothetical protein
MLGLWFRETATRVFNTCRVPRMGCDHLTPVPSSRTPESRTVVVLVFDWFYAVEVAGPTGDPLPVEVIERRLRQVAQDARARRRRGEEAVPVGILSSDHRDNWSKVLICAVTYD